MTFVFVYGLIDAFWYVFCLLSAQNWALWTMHTYTYTFYADWVSIDTCTYFNTYQLYFAGTWVSRIVAANIASVSPPDIIHAVQWSDNHPAPGESHAHRPVHVYSVWGDLWIFCHQSHGQLSGHQIPHAAVHRFGDRTWWLYVWWRIHGTKSRPVY